MQVRHKPRFRVHGLYLVAAACLLTAATAFAANDAFEAGVAASKRGDFQQAVEHFQAARDQGRDSPALYHNLGVAYYKLGRHDEARRAFRQAAESPKMRAISYYNLGLVAQKAGDEEGAQEWFREAHEAARTPKLRRLAAAQLDLTDRVVPPYRLYLEGFAGYDSNPRLADEEAIQRSDESDALFGALAAGRYLLSGDWDRGATLIGSAYADFHPDLDAEDIGSLTGGFGFHHSPGDWRHEYELVANQLWLGDDKLQTSGRAGLRSLRRLGSDLTAELRLRSEYIDGDDGNDFGYLTGWRHQARARLLGRDGPWRWKGYYEFEHNDRDDLRVTLNGTENFFSVSPARHEIGGSIERLLAGDLTGELGAAFRRSEYRDDEIREDVERGEREDDRIEVKVGLSRPLWDGWTGYLETTYWDNSSDCDNDECDRFEYDRVEALVSVGRSF